MISKRVLFASVTLAAAPCLAGCIFANGNNSTGSGPSTGDTTEQDIAQYESLQAKLEQHREVFKDGASELAGVGTRLFWLEFPTFDPSLHSYDAATSQTIDYAFSIGSGDKYNYRASDKLVVTAEPKGDTVVLHAYAIGKSNHAVDDLKLPAPSNGVRWWAYAPDKSDVYYVITTDATTLWRWTPGSGQPKSLFNLEDTGAEIGEFLDFGVDGNTMTFIESGRVWSLDIAAKKSTWLGNKTEASSVYADGTGALLGTASGPFFYGYKNKMLIDVAEGIESSGFSLNTTFASAHLFKQDLARRQSLVGYIGQDGFFTYDLNANKVTPILLNARDNSVVYRYPVLLEDGSVFVQGLESTSGATGAEGPVYRVTP
ncbi:Hypothetical protein A7982_04881 [Minicystis rosea]|nr:Hypothetical protein A7982_04881 [Minicystis rosea]